jgi:hypothetical protein
LLGPVTHPCSVMLARCKAWSMCTQLQMHVTRYLLDCCLLLVCRLASTSHLIREPGCRWEEGGGGGQRRFILAPFNAVPAVNVKLRQKMTSFQCCILCHAGADECQQSLRCLIQQCLGESNTLETSVNHWSQQCHNICT